MLAAEAGTGCALFGFDLGAAAGFILAGRRMGFGSLSLYDGLAESASPRIPDKRS